MNLENININQPFFFDFHGKKVQFDIYKAAYKGRLDKDCTLAFERIKLSLFQKTVFEIILSIGNFFLESNNRTLKDIRNILDSDNEIKFIIKLNNKYLKIENLLTKNTFPYIYISNKVDQIASHYKFKVIKAEAYSLQLKNLNARFLDNYSTPFELEEIYHSCPEKIKQILNNLVELYGFEKNKDQGQIEQNIRARLKKICSLKDAYGKNILLQLEELYQKKGQAYSEIEKLHELNQKIEQNSHTTDLLKALNDTTLSLELKEIESLPRDYLAKRITLAIQNIKQNVIKKIDTAFDDFLKKVHDELSIYEVTAQRLTDNFSDEILKKPIKVAMVGVEYSGLVKEGGLAEALEGLTKAMKTQHPDNEVSVIFPKFSILPENIQELINKINPTTHFDAFGKPYLVFKVTIEGIDYHFIDHPTFHLKGEKPSIYGLDNAELQARFSAFSGLAADFLQELKTDIIHLHDWHVAGVALKLAKKDPKKWENGEIPPIVFTYHNNSRNSQGMFAQGVYNYNPVIQGLIKAGIAKENTNLFVETLKIADSVTTVSETFGIESQDMRTGEGVSFAASEAAENGKLTGILNGSNPHLWNPEKDFSLKNWKDIETDISIDLSYGPTDTPIGIVEKKEKCKLQLQKWVNKHFPEVNVDFTKPIVTYIGRLDSLQKGIDKLDESIEATLKMGGQFIIMGSLEDARATKILDKLEAKYKKGVLFIRDYKDLNGRYHFQQGNDKRAGCGSLIRAASDFVLIPSRFEPCGLVQFEGWLFGSLAIGSNVGGLADTIIPTEKNPERFNGFLFDRDSKGSTSVGNVITKALQSWQNLTTEQKGVVIHRLIKEARMCSWSTAVEGYSPVEKYRFVYENAKVFAKKRASAAPIVDLNIRKGLLHERMQNQWQSSQINQVTEKYSRYFYSKEPNFKKLEQMYESIPKKYRTQVPSPYGREVDFQAYNELGAHLESNGVRFGINAPKAVNVLVKVYQDNRFEMHNMEKNEKGIWSGFIPGLKKGDKYQFLINNQIKLDPFGLAQTENSDYEGYPCSVVVDRNYDWQDHKWRNDNLANLGCSKPISIYEIHLAFWKKQGRHLNYREVANDLVAYCKKMGYTHVELMGILEHPNEKSLGYQVTGYFAPNSRMGTPEDFKYLIDTLHKNKIGVYLDMVPAHFAVDDYGLKNFDGTRHFEPSFLANFFSLRNLIFRWGTYFFDYDKKHVRDFLTSSAAYWIKEFHIDGLRIDALHSMLLSEKPKAARRFLKDLNAVVQREFPGVKMMAEDYSAGLETTKSPSSEGLGFDQKWNICWMENSLEYFSQHPRDRSKSYNKIIKAIMGDTYHKMIIAISHDEVRDGFKLLKSTNISHEDKLANLRAFLGYTIGVPGEKLMFMGNELGQEKSWIDLIGKTTGVLDTEPSETEQKIALCHKELNWIYKAYRPLWQHNDNGKDLTWIEKKDPLQIVHAYRRASNEGESVACLHNFSDKNVQEFIIPFENKSIFTKLKKSAILWKKKFGVDILSTFEQNQFAYLSCYPQIAKKIIKNPNLKAALYNWILKGDKPVEEFLKLNDWTPPPFKPVEVFNSDSKKYGGSGRLNSKIELIRNSEGAISGYKVRIPPLTTIFISENCNVVSQVESA